MYYNSCTFSTLNDTLTKCYYPMTCDQEMISTTRTRPVPGRVSAWTLSSPDWLNGWIGAGPSCHSRWRRCSPGMVPSASTCGKERTMQCWLVLALPQRPGHRATHAQHARGMSRVSRTARSSDRTNRTRPLPLSGDRGPAGGGEKLEGLCLLLRRCYLTLLVPRVLTYPPTFP